MGKRVISERVVSTKVIKKEIPIIGGITRKFKKVGASIKGFFTAFILLFVAFAIIIFSEKFERKSIIVEALPLEQAAEVSATSEMHKIEGVPIITNKVEGPENIGEVLYYDQKIEIYKEVEKVETETVNKTVDGQEVQETIERTVLVEEWTDVSSEKGKWATFSLGKYKIVPESASKKIAYKTNTYWLDYEWDEYSLANEGSARTPQLEDQRKTVNYLTTDVQLIVVGEIIKGQNDKLVIKSGETFIVTTKSDSALIESMQNSENASFWMLKVLAFAFLFAGLKGIIGPVLAILDFIPLVGKAANSVATFAAAVISVITIVIVSFVVRYLWVFILVPTLIIGFLLYKQFSKPEKEDTAKAE